MRSGLSRAPRAPTTIRFRASITRLTKRPLAGITTHSASILLLIVQQRWNVGSPDLVSVAENAQLPWAEIRADRTAFLPEHIPDKVKVILGCTHCIADDFLQLPIFEANEERPGDYIDIFVDVDGRGQLYVGQVGRPYKTIFD